MYTPSTFIVGIAGGSGSGKTTIARHLINGLPQETARLIQHDSYYKEQTDISPHRRRQQNFDHPDALDTRMLITHLTHLKSGNAIDIPMYDFRTHQRKDKVQRIEPAPVIIVEGILVFENHKLRDLFDLKLYVDTAADIRAIRRFTRDMTERQRDFDSIRDQYYRHVRPMHTQFVEPSKRWADLIIPESGEYIAGLEVITARLLAETSTTLSSQDAPEL